MSSAAEADEKGPGWSPIPDQDDYESDLASRLSRGFEPVTAGDWVMVAIAVVDILLLIARDVYANLLPTLAADVIIWVDLGILALFVLEFLGELRKASSKLLYTRNHWYEVVGMIPVAHWGIRIFRLVRLLRIYVVKTFPLEAAPERDWSYALVRGLISHYRSVLLEEITDPIVITSIGVIKGPMTRARWAGAIGESLQDHRAHIHTIVEDSIEENPRIAPLLKTRTGRRMVHQITDATLDSVIRTLESDELNEVIGESVGQILDELETKVRQKEYAMRGGSRLRPTFQEG